MRHKKVHGRLHLACVPTIGTCAWYLTSALAYGYTGLRQLYNQHMLRIPSSQQPNPTEPGVPQCAQRDPGNLASGPDCINAGAAGRAAGGDEREAPDDISAATPPTSAVSPRPTRASLEELLGIVPSPDMQGASPPGSPPASEAGEGGQPFGYRWHWERRVKTRRRREWRQRRAARLFEKIDVVYGTEGCPLRTLRRWALQRTLRVSGGLKTKLTPLILAC